MATLAMSTASKGIDLLVHSQDDCMLSTADNFLDAKVTECAHLLGLVEEVRISLTTLASVMLTALAATPGEQRSQAIDGSAMEVTASNLGNVSTGHLATNLT